MTKPDAHDIAMKIAEHEDSIGAIVIILTTDGDLDISTVSALDEDDKSPLDGIVEAIKNHCDEHHRSLDQPAAPPGN